MSKLSEIMLNIKENKTVFCVLISFIYMLGLCCFYLPNTKVFALIFTFIILLLILLTAFSKKFSKIFSSFFFLILYLIFIFGFLNAKIHYKTIDDFSSFEYYKNVRLRGTVAALPKYISTTANYKFPFKVKNAVIAGVDFDIKDTTVLVVIKDKEEKLGGKLKYGDDYILTGTISTPSHASNPSQFDYNNFLNNKGILKTFYVNDGAYEYLSSPKISDIKNKSLKRDKIKLLSSLFIRKMHDIRDDVIKKHEKYIKTPRLEVLGGVVFGDDAVNPPDEIKGSFINSGLLHLLAASGLNVALILSMWFCIVYFINISYRLKIFSGIFIVFLYTLMTGFPPSIVRASVMLLLILIGKLMYRETSGVSLIFMAGLIILIFKPEFICDVGFQLSFLVTLGLIICVPSINSVLSDVEKNYIQKIKKYPNIVKSFLLYVSPVSLCCCVLIPFIAQLWAAPLQAYYFNTFSSYSVFANIAVVPFIGIVSFLGFISTAICFVPHVSDLILPVFDCVLNFVIQIILNISNFFSNLPNSLIKVPSPENYQIILFYIFVVFLFLSFKFLFKNKKVNKILICSFLIFLLSLIKIPNNTDEVIFFSVGNADNALIKTKNDKYIMIDTGRYIYNGLSSAKTITLEYFYDKNIKEIDTIIVSHYDSDHSGGLIDLLDNLKVKNVIIPEVECTSKNSCAIKDYIEKNDIKYIKPYSGQKFVVDDVEITNFVSNIDSKKSRNDNSTVTLADIEGYKFLFMADAGIIPYYSLEKLIPDIDVLKSAHHGANNTVDYYMMKKLTPSYSVLSTGKNPYGHPNKDTVKILSKFSKVLSTKDLGAIKFKIKEKIEVYHYDHRKRKFVKIN